MKALLLILALTGCALPTFGLDGAMERALETGGALYFKCDLPEFDHCRVRPGGIE